MGIFDWFKGEDQVPETRKNPPIKCPKCALLNPDNALQCDCGYRFPMIGIEDYDPKTNTITLIDVETAKQKLFKKNGTQKSEIVKIQDPYNIDVFYEIDSGNIICTCNDFKENRADYSEDDPRRLCKHIIRVFREKDNIPDGLKIYKYGIEFFASRNIDFPIMTYKKNSLLNGEKIEIFFDDYDDTERDFWISIYYKGNRYGYDLINCSWASYNNTCNIYSRIPDNEEQILNWIKTQINGYHRKPLWEGSIKTISRKKGKKKCNIKGVVEGKTILAHIEFGKNITTMTLCSNDDNWSGWNIEFNPKTKEIEIPSHLKYMENAIIRWITEECNNISVM